MSHRSLSCIILTIFFIAPTKGFESRKLDETGISTSSDTSVKCGGCSPCGNPSCYSSPPPPSLPPPPPPSPPKKPPTTTPYCPPPPSSSGHSPSSASGSGSGSGSGSSSGSMYGPPSGSGFVYTTAPPGDLYPVVQNSSSPPNLTDAMKLTFGLGFLGFLFFWT